MANSTHHWRPAEVVDADARPNWKKRPARETPTRGAMAKLTDEQRTALQMLAASAPGHSLSTLLVRGCDFEMLQGLVLAGWASARQHAFGRGSQKS
jgi:hypothetical protein